MAISNNQDANATNFNAAFVSKTADSTTVGSLTVNKPADGASVNVQVDINALKADVLALEGDNTTAAELASAISTHAADGNAHIVSDTTANLTALTRAAGTIYYSTDEAQYYGDDGTDLIAIGSGTGGSGGINYILNPDAEDDTSGWATYLDAAGTSPVDGTGGTALQTTFTQHISNVLRGSYSFLIAKSAANGQGEGVGYNFTIDRSSKYKVLSIKFDYEIETGTYADNDITVWIYDVTNSTLIQPAGHQIKNSGVNASHQATFQTTNSTSYRLIFHVSSTSALAYSMKLDEISVGPQSIARGPMISDWVSYTPTFTGLGSVTPIDFYWRRVGSDIEVRGRAVAGSPTGVEARMSLPTGLTSSSSIPTLQLAGYFARATTGAEFDTMLIEPSVAYFTFGKSSGAAAGFVKLNGSSVVASEAFSINARAPIAGWSSNQVLSSEEDGRVCVAAYHVSANFAASTTTPINFDTKETDTHNAVTPSATVWKFTAPIAGNYSIIGFWLPSTNISLQVYKNGTIFKTLGHGDGVSGVRGSFGGTISLLAGDYIDFRPAGASTITGGAKSAANVANVNIYRLSGPAQIAASESVSASYWLSANWTLVSATAIPFDSKDYDSHGSFTSGTGAKFTAPISGEYEVGGYFKNNASLVSGVTLAVYKNGAQSRTLGAWDNTNIDITPNTKIKLLAGEYIDIRITAAPGGGAIVGGASMGTNGVSYLQITRTGNY